MSGPNDWGGGRPQPWDKHEDEYDVLARQLHESIAEGQTVAETAKALRILDATRAAAPPVGLTEDDFTTARNAYVPPPDPVEPTGLMTHCPGCNGWVEEEYLHREECPGVGIEFESSVRPPDRVAGLREADQETWRQRIVEHLGPQRMSLYMSKDIDRMATGAVIAAAVLAEPVQLDAERLARALEVLDDDPDILPSLHADEVAAEYARLTDLKGATDGE